MFLRYCLLIALLACATYAIQVKPSNGPQAQRLPHREYGVPQQIPFREYAPPSSKYVPPKLNFVGGGGSHLGLHEQLKNYYGAPKPFYGPPHKIQQKYSSPSDSSYGSPPLKLNKPFPLYGPPTSQYNSAPPQGVPLFQPPLQFNPSHQPASSYGPPPSGPLIIPPKKIFGPPPANYGPPPLPNFNKKAETTIILKAEQNSHNQHQQQQQIKIDSSSHSHSLAGSQGRFQTACDGWKPIPAPAGFYIESNQIATQTGYSQVAQNGGGSNPGPRPELGATLLVGGSATGGNNIINSLSDEQLVAVALQSSTFDVDNSVQQQEILPPTGPAGDFNKQSLNSIEAEALQLTLGSLDDSYSKPPTDSFAPGSKYFYNKQSSLQNSFEGDFSISGPGPSLPPTGKYGPPQAPKGSYGPPPTGNYGPPLPPKVNYGLRSPSPNSNYGPPPAVPLTGIYGPPPFSGPGSATFGNFQAQANLGIQYGKQYGNLGPFPPHSGVQPSKPVAYRPPVPPGLFESIGATVQHLDTFGVKPQLQSNTYIPPAANELPQTGPANLNIDYGTPHQLQQQVIPQNIIEQQLPQPRQPQIFLQIEQQQSSQQQQQFGDDPTKYGVPALPLLSQQVPPQLEYLPAPLTTGIHPNSNGVASFDNTAIASNQFNQETPHIQALPLQQTHPRFHDCGHGPSLIRGNSLNYQQQYSTSSGTSIAQSIPVSEQHTHFISGPSTSYGHPPSGGNELDHISNASENSQVTAFPDGTYSEGLPGLDGINLLSAQKSETIHFNSQEPKTDETYQIQFGSGDQQQSANHEEVLSADLLQTILNAVEQSHPQHQPLPANHKAESRSDIDIKEEAVEDEDENKSDAAFQESKNVEVKVQQEDEKSLETDAEVQEMKPIVIIEENEDKH